MEYDFDRVINRWKTNCEKYDTITQNGYPEDMIPLWVADMDFTLPDCVKKAMHEAVDRGIFGYSLAGDDFYSAVEGWFSRRYGWKTDRSWIIHTPGVVTALSAAVRTVTEPGDGVLIQSPVYHQFFNVINRNGRTVVENELRYEDGKYSIDFVDFEEKIAKNSIKLFIMCSPHNPVCRVWTPEELKEMGRICKKHNVVVFADEIYCDFFSPGYTHTPFATVCPEMLEHLIVSTSPSKGFNIAGLQISNIFIPGEELRAKFRKTIDIVGYNECNYMGMVACCAAYSEGEQWLEACKAYIWENVQYIQKFVAEKLPQIHIIEPQGTYLLWMDCSGLGLSPEELEDLLLHKANIWPDMGTKFGEKTGQFIRLALACPRSVIVEAMDRLEKAVREYKR
ncbi:MAG: pyridoxal phosphate-dependent aminotransferase [Oscillospiraceae bacterium]|nr:pyridoxal phosphate-dependent aminotransferase [Oscillospiraceae bacterium]